MIFSDVSNAFEELTGETGQVLTIKGKQVPAIVQPITQSVEYMPGIELEGVQFSARISKRHLPKPPSPESIVQYLGGAYRINGPVTDSPVTYHLQLASAASKGR